MQLNAWSKRIWPARIHQHHPEDVTGTAENQFVCRKRTPSCVPVTAADNEFNITQTVIFTKRRYFVEHCWRVVDNLAELMIEWWRHQHATVGIVVNQLVVGQLFVLCHQTWMLCTRRIALWGMYCRIGFICWHITTEVTKQQQSGTD